MEKNPLWFDWHEDNNEDEWSYSMNGVSKIHPIKLKNALFKLIVSVIKESKTTSFYFKPTNKQRGNIYSNLINKLLSDLGPEWTTQNIDNKWFYYNKN